MNVGRGAFQSRADLGPVVTLRRRERLESSSGATLAGGLKAPVVSSGHRAHASASGPRRSLA